MTTPFSDDSHRKAKCIQRPARGRCKHRRDSLQTRHLQAQLYSAAALIFGVPLSELEAPMRRPARVARARQTAMYLAHVGKGLPLRLVGQMFRRDRTTVAHACAAIEDRRDDQTFDQALCWIERAMAWAPGVARDETATSLTRRA